MPTPSPPDSLPSASRAPALPVWKKVLFSLVVLAVSAAALELVLAACGFAPRRDLRDPYVGFSSYLPLFVERTIDGQEVLQTAPNKRSFFNVQQFPRRKPPGTYRIFCLGGSTTYGRPYDDQTSFCGWLRRFLPAADPTRNWEVVNAGGISYASYRSAKLMEELVHYQPDLFIIYSGHNEFLERRTYGAMLSAPASLRAVGGLLSQTHTYAALTHLVQGPRNGTDRRFVLPQEVRALLDDSIGPDDYRRDDALSRQILAHYRFNLGRMVQLARTAGAEVLFVVPASNLRDCSPFKSVHKRGLTPRDRIAFARLLERAKRMTDAGDLQSALKAADQALAIDGRYAELHFVRGRILYEAGRYADAKAAFQRACEEDVCPLRALPQMERIVRDVASSHDVPCVDFSSLVQRRAENGIPGSDWFLDHVHPTIEGNRLIAERLLQEMVRQGLVRPQDSWGPRQVEQIAQQVQAAIDERAHGIALRNLSKVMGWAGKLEEAAALSDRALALAPDDPETQFQAGIVAEDRNDLEAAEIHYRRAKELDPDFDAVYINLGVVLGKQGKYAEARAEFEKGLERLPQCEPLLCNVAMAASLQGDYEAAIEFQRLAIKYAPAERRRALRDQLREYEMELDRKAQQAAGRRSPAGLAPQ